MTGPNTDGCEQFGDYNEDHYNEGLMIEEIKRLQVENEKLREFVADQLCDCYDEYGEKRPQMCDRCKLLGRE